ncbi:DUF1640 domain-containing protein [Propylenella binzhouense]|uniref:DUF1640 domain-containing protein n=1 Tax=Propylenella binzhouense TaxID=2555902 RepID=A0A964WVV1_9HYPH|nr:DUF1640 domain-containing protein [Propylenella binzhouense]MYZ50210.1 DUF1640 domain-containing protein [Propylenella binzhouense]
MNIMVTEIYDALMSAGADEEKARRAAEALAVSDRELRSQFADLREDNQKMRTEMAALRGELKGEMAALRGELKGDMTKLEGSLRSDMAALRGELKGDMTKLEGSFRSEMAALQGGLRHEMQGLRGELSLIKWMLGALIGLWIAVLLRMLFA